MNIERNRIIALSQKIYWSKMRLLVNYGFFGLLLLDKKFVLSNDFSNKQNGISTDGETIYIDPDYLESLNDISLDIVIMHEIMHIVLKHIQRGDMKSDPLFNYAADIVVNSNIMYARSFNEQDIYIKGKKLEHLAPNGKEGYLYSVDEIYEMLMAANHNKNNKPTGNEDTELFSMSGDSFTQGKNKSGKDNKNKSSSGIDDHKHWGDASKNPNEDKSMKEDMLNKRILEAYELSEKRDIGNLPGSIKRIIEQLKNPKINWRVFLNNFIQEEVNDYSFSPPDKRFTDSIFILPDFNDKEDVVKNVLFMVDCSGSMSILDITDCFSEIKGAIEQYNGKLEGYLGFFDTKIYDVLRIDGSTDITKIIPQGGGGTDVLPIFDYIEENMKDNPPTSLIILTDGYILNWPTEEITKYIPILWVINNEEQTPPFGKVARII